VRGACCTTLANALYDIYRSIEVHSDNTLSREHAEYSVAWCNVSSTTGHHDNFCRFTTAQSVSVGGEQEGEDGEGRFGDDEEGDPVDFTNRSTAS
jgi:hypothetical protein